MRKVSNCRHCKKKIEEAHLYTQVKLSFVHSTCLDSFIGLHVNKVKDKKEKTWNRMKGEKKKGTYKKTLWTNYFSPYIRQREMDANGNTKCISCGVLGHWQSMHAGHFIPKSAGEYFYFNEDNVWSQCPNCNTYGSQDTGANYQKNLREKIGDERVDALLDAKNNRPVCKHTLSTYQALAKEYKSKLNNLL